MHITVRVFGFLKEVSKEGATTLNFDDEPNIDQVIMRLVEHNEELGSRLWDPIIDSYTPNALVLIDGVEAGNLNGPRTRVREGCEVIILPVTHGG